VPVSERDNALEETVKCCLEPTSDSSSFLNAVCLLKYVLNYEHDFSYFNPD
jgi:hypothetical protein